ncbi:MAG: tetratricopeptide repeat protein [Ardenticatenaceae bacterium]|nr:tetratricopeptide repeat protein [Ardenticatenaceae bacterium]
MLTFSLLGQATVAEDGVPLDQFRSQREVALLIYLAHTGQVQPRDFLAELLWNGRSTKQALSNLRTVLARLRKQVGDKFIATRTSVSFAPETGQQPDSVRLLETLTNMGTIDSSETATLLQQTLESYQGDFLAGFHLPDSPQFNDWVLVTREHIHRQVVAAYDKLGQYALSTGDVAYGIATARRWLQMDELDESAHTLLIRLLLEAGNVREAMAHYDHCVQLLKMELGVAPPAAMTALVKDVVLSPVVLSRVTAVRHNLPAPHDQFFGRETAQQEIHTRLDQPWCRLVTLIGQGGAGKTRLASTIARSRLGQYRDGVWLVELADLDPDDDDLAEAIAVEIATALDLRLTGSTTPAEQLLNHLRHKQMLLVLDNFEHLLSGVPIVLDILQQCEQVQLIATSREMLGLQAEWIVALTGLTYPASDSDEQRCDAVDLFAARWAQQQRGEMAAGELTAVRHICRLVEGLPLAIELAAALTRRTTCQAIANRLDKGFDSLTTSLRDVEPRHRALHVVFAMSWRTLTPELQACLARLSVFRGGFTAAAAQHIAAADEPQLAALGDKSLLAYDAATDRYALHAVVRAYAAEKCPPTDQTLPQHADYYLNWLAQYAEPLQKSAPQEVIALIQPDVDNVRLAWQTGLAGRKVTLLAALTPFSIYYQLRGLSHEAEAVMQMTVRTATAWGDDGVALAIRAGLELARFQNRLGRCRPAIQSVKTALQLAAGGSDRWAEGMGLVLWGEALWRLGEYEASENRLSHALDLAHALDATLIIGWCHHHLGIINDIQTRYAAAHDHLQQACAAWQTLDNAQALCGSLNSIGLVCYHQGELPAAQQAMEQALALCNQIDNHALQSLLLNNLSMIATTQGDYNGAQYYLQLGLEFAKARGDLVAQGHLYTNLGKNYRLLGETALATENLMQGLKISEAIGNPSLTATAMLDLAETESVRGNLERSEALYMQALETARQSNLQGAECEILIGMAAFWRGIDKDRARQSSTEAVALAKVLQNQQLLERANATVPI